MTVDSKGTMPGGMPAMMREMMRDMMSKPGSGDFNPAAMCQAMMTSVDKAATMAAYATPEVRTLFEEWARSVEDEVLVALRSRGPLDLGALAAALKISPESALFFLGKLVRDGKATIGSIRAAP
jgi:hypothetical protein